MLVSLFQEVHQVVHRWSKSLQFGERNKEKQLAHTDWSDWLEKCRKATTIGHITWWLWNKVVLVSLACWKSFQVQWFWQQSILR